MRNKIIELSFIFMLILNLVLGCCFDSSKDEIKNINFQQFSNSIAIYKGNIERTGVFNTTPPSKEFKVKWKIKINSGTKKEHLRFYDRPVALNSTVYIASGILHAIDINSGVELWNISGKGLSYPIIYNGNIFTTSIVTTHNNLILYCISSDGKIVWEKYLPLSYLSPEMIINNGILYVGFESYVYAWDAYTGREIWKYYDEDVDFYQPAMEDRILYFPASIRNSKINSNINDTRHTELLIAINSETGKEIWRCKVSHSYSDTPVIYDGKVYLIDGNSNIYCLNAKNGKIIRVFETIYQEAIASSSIIVWKNNIFFKTQNYYGDTFLYCINAINGKEIWKKELEGSIFNVSAVCNGVLYITDDDYIISIDPETGKTIHKVKIGPVHWSSLYIYDGKIFIGCDDGYLYCLE